MEPLKPSVKKRILETNPEATPEDIEEYERLLAERFATDPNLPKSSQIIAAEATRERRLAELYRKLFRATKSQNP